MHSLPFGLRCRLISLTTLAILLFHWSTVQPAGVNFSFLINSSTCSQSQAEQTPHISPAPLSTIRTYCERDRNRDRRLSWVSRLPDSGNKDMGSQVSREGTVVCRCLQKSVIPDTAYARARLPGTGTGSLGRRLSCPPTAKIAGSSAACPSMCRTFPTSEALSQNSRHLQGGLLTCRDRRIACVWNSDFTVWGFHRTILTLCFKA